MKIVNVTIEDLRQEHIEATDMWVHEIEIQFRDKTPRVQVLEKVVLQNKTILIISSLIRNNITGR